jgi:hypothetical protein
MKKIHTRKKRKYGLSTHLNWYSFFHNVKPKRIRPKTFRTEESAHSWAATHGLKKGDYSLKKAKHDKRFEMARLL